jgi:hypothetical protein
LNPQKCTNKILKWAKFIFNVSVMEVTLPMTCAWVDAWRKRSESQREKSHKDKRKNNTVAIRKALGKRIVIAGKRYSSLREAERLGAGSRATLRKLCKRQRQR